MPTEDMVLDARGQLCPMPVMKTGKLIRELAPGQVLKVLATDRGSLVDMPAWADDTGNELIDTAEQDGTLVFWIRRAEEDE
jgi:tRNA 2-thiouridine synthesizing protein A